MKEQVGLNETELNQYFPVPHIVKTTLEIYEELLGLKFKNVECSVWAKQVTCHRVYDSETNELLGQFYLDLFTRKNK